mmetsp:Transcript_12294/g.23330  ORF Transcript_12294/g.23330 Transcript_12294/m.23330 type:complete len:127 (+) Transcript_12294:41-421(+)
MYLYFFVAWLASAQLDSEELLFPNDPTDTQLASSCLWLGLGILVLFSVTLVLQAVKFSDYRIDSVSEPLLQSRPVPSHCDSTFRKSSYMSPQTLVLTQPCTPSTWSLDELKANERGVAEVEPLVIV